MVHGVGWLTFKDKKLIRITGHYSEEKDNRKTVYCLDMRIPVVNVYKMIVIKKADKSCG